jgi:hypothetical protein
VAIARYSAERKFVEVMDKPGVGVVGIVSQPPVFTLVIKIVAAIANWLKASSQRKNSCFNATQRAESASSPSLNIIEAQPLKNRE